MGVSDGVVMLASEGVVIGVSVDVSVVAPVEGVSSYIGVVVPSDKEGVVDVFVLSVAGVTEGDSSVVVPDKVVVVISTDGASVGVVEGPDVCCVVSAVIVSSVDISGVSVMFSLVIAVLSENTGRKVVVVVGISPGVV